MFSDIIHRNRHGVHTEEIKSYLRKSTWNKASVTDICRYTNLSRDEVKSIVDAEGDLELDPRVDYIKHRT